LQILRMAMLLIGVQDQPQYFCIRAKKTVQ